MSFFPSRHKAQTVFLFFKKGGLLIVDPFSLILRVSSLPPGKEFFLHQIKRFYCSFFWHFDIGKNNKLPLTFLLHLFHYSQDIQHYSREIFLISSFFFKPSSSGFFIAICIVTFVHVNVKHSIFIIILWSPKNFVNSLLVYYNFVIFISLDLKSQINLTGTIWGVVHLQGGTNSPHPTVY